MTEEEAKTKWCFHFIASHTNPRAETSEWDRDQGETSPFVHHCIGSACMAWRVKERTEIRHKHTGSVVPPDAWRMRGDYEEVRVPDGGYCGIAGAPQ